MERDRRDREDRIERYIYSLQLLTGCAQSPCAKCSSQSISKNGGSASFESVGTSTNRSCTKPLCKCSEQHKRENCVVPLSYAQKATTSPDTASGPY